MNKIIYKFKCINSTCKHEYVGDKSVMKCPKCGTLNQAIDSFIPKN